MAFNFVEWKENQSRVLIYRGRIPNVGAFKKTVFSFEEHETGICVHIWGGAVLYSELYGLPFHTKLLITFLGYIQEDEMKHPAKNFSVEIIETNVDKHE